MNATDEKAAPPARDAAETTDARKITTAPPRRANKAPARRWPFGASVGDLIERARRAAP